jgi:hypothetical protein
MEPIDLLVVGKRSQVAAVAHVEHDAAQDIALHQDEGRQTQGAGERPLIVVEFGRQQNGTPVWILKFPTGHAENCGADASASDLVRVARVPGFSGGEAWLASWICEDFRRIP